MLPPLLTLAKPPPLALYVLYWSSVFIEWWLSRHTVVCELYSVLLRYALK